MLHVTKFACFCASADHASSAPTQPEYGDANNGCKAIYVLGLLAAARGKEEKKHPNEETGVARDN